MSNRQFKREYATGVHNAGAAGHGDGSHDDGDGVSSAPVCLPVTLEVRQIN